MHLVEFTGGDGRVLQRTETTPAQASIFSSLDMKEPPRFFKIAAR